MPQTNDALERKFIILSQATYGPACLANRGNIVDDICVSLDTPDGGLEFLIEWHQFSHGSPCPRLCVFEDAWAAFALIPELFTRLAVLHKTNPSVWDVVRLLTELGFTDATPRELTNA